MDAGRFDQLSRIVSSAGTRRRVLALLAALPLVGRVSGPSNESAAAKHQRQKRSRGQNTSQRQHRRRGQHRGLYPHGEKVPEQETTGSQGQEPELQPLLPGVHRHQCQWTARLRLQAEGNSLYRRQCFGVLLWHLRRRRLPGHRIGLYGDVHGMLQWPGNLPARHSQHRLWHGRRRLPGMRSLPNLCWRRLRPDCRWHLLSGGHLRRRRLSGSGHARNVRRAL